MPRTSISLIATYLFLFFPNCLSLWLLALCLVTTQIFSENNINYLLGVLMESGINKSYKMDTWRVFDLKTQPRKHRQALYINA